MDLNSFYPIPYPGAPDTDHQNDGKLSFLRKWHLLFPTEEYGCGLGQTRAGHMGFGSFECGQQRASQGCENRVY